MGSKLLDLTDLLQEGYCAFYKAWTKLNWDIIDKADEQDKPAVITNYLKLNIKNDFRSLRTGDTAPLSLAPLKCPHSCDKKASAVPPKKPLAIAITVTSNPPFAWDQASALPHKSTIAVATAPC